MVHNININSVHLKFSESVTLFQKSFKLSQSSDSYSNKRPVVVYFRVGKFIARIETYFGKYFFTPTYLRLADKTT